MFGFVGCQKAYAHSYTQTTMRCEKKVFVSNKIIKFCVEVEGKACARKALMISIFFYPKAILNLASH
jgi:hypothetical protein